jgi:transposase-like protein
MGLLERTTAKRASRVKLQVLKGRRKAELQKNVREYVLKDSNLYTDALPSYNGLNDDYTHQVIDHAEKYVDGAIHTNGLENFWCLLKRTIKGTYVNVEPFHLFRYLDEQAFRFNEREDTDKGRFMKAMAGIIGKSLTFAQLTGKNEAGGGLTPA